MRRHSCSFLVLAAVLPFVSAGAPAPQSPPKSPRDALQPFNDLIGTWRCTGTPSGSAEERQRGFWTETLAIEWQFKGKDAWLKLDFAKDKESPKGEPRFVKGELRHRPATDDFALTLVTPKKEALVYTGKLDERHLLLERQAGGEVHRLKFSLWHANRFTYSYSTRPASKSRITPHWSVGATKEGEAFAAGDGNPECIVSGGKGTMAVTYQGKTYYVCCSGCRSEFNEHPQKYIDEYNAKKAKKAK
ncbi:MAG: YHS domain-containing protein [Gemmataceae bacterium]|nr:YHS domain-containing protein [Gemmataceae bacterium]